MFDANSLLGRVIDSGAASGFLGGVLGGGAVGMLQSKKASRLRLEDGPVAELERAVAASSDEQPRAS